MNLTLKHKVVGGVVAAAAVIGITAAASGGGDSTGQSTASDSTAQSSSENQKVDTDAAPAAETVGKVAVPDVTDKDGATAKDELERAGFTNVELASGDSESSLVMVPANWTVTKQSVESGTKAATDQLIVLTASKHADAPESAKMPDVAGKDGATAQYELEQAGFNNVQFASADADDHMVLMPANWTVTKQSVSAGTQAGTDQLVVLTATKG